MDDQLGRRDARVDRKESLRFDHAARLLLDLALEGVEEPFSQLDLSTRKLPAAVDDSDEEDIPLLVGYEPAHGKYVRRMVAFGHRSVVPTQICSALPPRPRLPIGDRDDHSSPPGIATRTGLEHQPRATATAATATADEPDAAVSPAPRSQTSTETPCPVARVWRAARSFAAESADASRWPAQAQQVVAREHVAQHHGVRVADVGGDDTRAARPRHRAPRRR